MDFVKVIITALFGAIFDRVDRWLTEMRLKRAEAEAEALKIYLASLQDAKKTEAEMAEAAAKVEAKYSEVQGWKEKLDALRKLAEERQKTDKDSGDKK
jgi:hypothetical protein